MRSYLFWAHLIAGVLAGIVILVMSVTGVLLTYERQIIEWTDQQYVRDADGRSPLSADELLNIVRPWHQDEHHFFIRIVNHVGAAVPVWAGNHSYLLDPYTGEVLREGEGAVADFFHHVTDIHRWLAMEGSSADAARAVTAYSNLLFLFLIVTGIYLWLPSVWRWTILRSRILFMRAPTAPARHFNWHHVLGFWALVPLFFIVLSATIFYFPWANAMLYGAFGEDAPPPQEEHELEHLIDGDMSYAYLLERAKNHAHEHGASDWHSIWIELGEAEGQASFYIDRSIGRRPAFAYDLTLDTDDGSVIEVKRHDDWSPGDQAWDVARFLHTGEHFGFVGQTIAGLASLAACFMVYTGLALAWRRLVRSPGRSEA